MDAWSVGSRCRAVEDYRPFVRNSGAAWEAESVRLEAELAEWMRIEAVLEGGPGARYDPDTDPVAVAAVHQERRREGAAADARAAGRRAEREHRDRVLRRAEDLLDLAQARGVGRLGAR